MGFRWSRDGITWLRSAFTLSQRILVGTWNEKNRLSYQWVLRDSFCLHTQKTVPNDTVSSCMERNCVAAFLLAVCKLDERGNLALALAGIQNMTLPGNLISMHFNFYWHRMLLEDPRWVFSSSRSQQFTLGLLVEQHLGV